MANYITINDGVDYWGECGEDFDPVAEGNRIAAAAELAGICVIRNVEHGVSLLVDDDDIQVNWWDTWCSAGYEWSDEEWGQWMQEQK